MKKILNALFLTIITLVTFSCSDVPAPYDINEGGGGSSSLEGEGTKENPYTVADAMYKQDGTEAWVKGYIVGIMANKYKPDGTTFDGNEPVFTAPFDLATNVLIAATADETNIKNCLPVKIKSGSDLSKAINLKDHPDNLGKPLIIKGKLSAGFGMAALIETTAAVFDGKDIGDDEGGGEVEGAYINESFKTSLGKFTSVSITGTLSWYNDFQSAMVKGGSATEKFPSETWLVAPTIDLSAETAAYITFDHAINYADAATIKDYHQLMISKNYTGDVASATWTPLAITMASGNSFTFVNSGKISIPADCLGQAKVTVALRYISTETTGSTWEVQNFVVAHGEGGGSVDPEEPSVPTEGPGSKDEPYDVATVLTKQDNSLGWVKGFIVGGVNSDQNSSSVNGPEDVIFGVEGIRNSAIIIAASANETDYTKCLVIGFGSDSNDAKAALRLDTNKDNLGKEVKLCGTLKNAFSAPGMKTITDFEFVGGDEPGGVTEQIFFENFEGEGGVSKKKLADFVGYLDKSLTFSDSGIADIRTLNDNFNLWLPSNKPTVVLITGFSTEGYKTLKLTYKIACFNKDVDWSTIKVKCGDTAMTVPEGKTVGSNTFEEIVIDNVPVGINSISFISDDANTQGFRIDDIKLEGTK